MNVITRPAGRRRRGRRFAATVALGALLASGCQFQGLYNLPLPGAAAQGSNTYTVHAIFSNVMSLVPDASVRVHGVTVGHVGAITLTKNYQAEVALVLPDSVNLPANAAAVLSQSSLLGTKYIALAAPLGIAPVGRLRNGDVIANGNTSQDATVEEVFSALSALLNGGGVEQLQAIDQELTAVMHGRESQIRGFFNQLTTLVSNLDGQQQNIIAALTGLNRLAGQLASQRVTLARALTNLGPGLQVLAEQRPELVAMLTALNRLGRIGSQIITASQQTTVADFAALRPILTELAAAGTALPHSLELLFDYPFPKNAQRAIPSDYTGLSVSLDLQSFLRMFSSSSPVPVPGSASSGGSPTSTLGSAVSKLPSLPSLPQVIGGLTLTPQKGSGSSVSGLAQLLDGSLG